MGAAEELRAQGATVYVTGRTLGPGDFADGCTPIVCDPHDDYRFRPHSIACRGRSKDSWTFS